MGGSLSSQHCIVASHLYGNTRGGSHSGVAKWDLRTQGGQVSRVLITGLNADTASASRRGGRNRFALASVQYNRFKMRLLNSGVEAPSLLDTSELLRPEQALKDKEAFRYNIYALSAYHQV